MNASRRDFLNATGAAALLITASTVGCAATPAKDLKAGSAIALPPLPYAMSSLAPVMSEETLQFHYGKHHQGYVTNVNAMIAGTSLQGASLAEVIQASAGRADANMVKLHQNSAQVFNHDFFWQSLSPRGGGAPSSDVLKLTDYGNAADLRKAFIDAATGRFASGWAWLVYDTGARKLRILTTQNEETPLTMPGLKALCVLDVWEHAYYIDYRNLRKAYAEAVYDKLMNWRFVEANLTNVA